ncbi:MAG: PP-loop family protein [Desulfovibrio sp.]|nr:PP-loop family protein [Desulfovibrio sp.]
MAAVALPGKLRQILAVLPKIALAFSGGVDSRFLAHAALLCGCELLALNASGPHISQAETAWARNWARKRGIRLIALEYDPLDLPEIRANSRQRCYACKKALLGQIQTAIAGFGPEWQICDGGNSDDLQKFRPGQKAVAEAGALSPLAAAGIGKNGIRELARTTGMDFCEQPSRPCLLTRLNYGISPTLGLLSRIAACEEGIAARFGPRLDFRLRLAPAPVLQITARPPAGLRQLLAKYGFGAAEIRQCGTVSGFFDQPEP